MNAQQTFNLKANKRTITGKKVKILRAQGQVPGVIYGYNTENLPLVVDVKKFRKIWDEAGSSALVDLEIDNNQPIKVLIQDVITSPVYDEIQHVDFFAVNLKEKVTTEIPLTFVGEAPAVKELEGSLVTQKQEVEVEALPTDLISEIEVDISMLKTFDDVIMIKDLKVPDTITIMHDPEEIVAQVAEPRSQEELEAELAEDTAAAEEAAVEELGKEPTQEKGEEMSSEGETEQSAESAKS